MSPITVSQDAKLVNTVKKVELVMSRLRIRPNRSAGASASAVSTFIDPSLSLVEKAHMLKMRASRIARRVQVDKTDETASTSESLTRSGILFSLEDSGVTWYKEAPTAYDDYGEIWRTSMYVCIHLSIHTKIRVRDQQKIFLCLKCSCIMNQPKLLHDEFFCTT